MKEMDHRVRHYVEIAERQGPGAVFRLLLGMLDAERRSRAVLSDPGAFRAIEIQKGRETAKVIGVMVGPCNASVDVFIEKTEWVPWSGLRMMGWEVAGADKAEASAALLAGRLPS